MKGVFKGKTLENKRGRPKRRWVKLDCNGILHGSINWQLNLDEQAIWMKLIAFSAVCGGTPGVLCDNDGSPIPNNYIAHSLYCSKELLESCIKKCIDAKRIENNGNGYKLTNFESYQATEYDRQQPYRQAKKERENDPEKYIKGKYGHMVQRGLKDEH